VTNQFAGDEREWLEPDGLGGFASGTVEQRLLTPLGLRSLAPGEPGYTPHYGGGPEQRDGAYHQGTVWPWLMGGFVDAWLAVRGNTPERQREARERFLTPLRAHLAQAGLGHVSEIADAEPPFTPRGCPFQAWSLGELIRIEAAVRTTAPDTREQQPAEGSRFRDTTRETRGAR
jgi:glycogen debranching enzyme